MKCVLKQTAIKYISSYRGLSIQCWVNIIFTLLNAIAVGVCFFLSLYFVDTLQFDMVMIGVLMSCYGIGTVTGGFVSGKLCDQVSPRRLILVSLLIQSLAFFSLVIFHTYNLLIVALFVLGFSNYSFKTANNVSMLNSCHENTGMRLKAINVSYAASNFGLGISGILIGAISSGGFHNVFYSASIILCLSALLFYVFETKNYQLTISQPHSSINEKNENQTKRKDILILSLLSTFFVGIIIAQLGSTYPVYVKDAFPELATQAVSILFILDTVLIVLFQAPLSNFHSRFNTVLVMGAGAFLMGLGMFVLSCTSYFIMAMISCCIWTTGEMLFIPTAQLLCYEHGDAKRKGQSMGIFQSMYAISTVVGPTLGGLMYTNVGVNFMWYLSMVIGVLCMSSCFFLLKQHELSIQLG